MGGSKYIDKSQTDTAENKDEREGGQVVGEVFENWGTKKQARKLMHKKV